MAVRFIAVTPDAEKTSSYIARVSNPQNQDNPEYTKLLKYCLKSKHWSVFEHAFITMEIETSRAIGRQIIRHKSLSFSEFSQRYSEVTDEMITVHARAQDPKNRQSSHDSLLETTKEEFLWSQKDVWDTAMTAYKEALDLGISKESARALLPEGLTPTRLYMSGSVRSWITYIALRSGNGTQLEHQAIAEECKKIFIETLPIIGQACEELEWKF